MLAKNPELQIDPADPFKNDCLSRKQSVEDLVRLIQSTTQPFVLSIQAPWGYGKTTFVKMLKAELERAKHPCLYFNAWENDFAEDPLIAFIGEMGVFLDNARDKGKNEKAKRALANAKKFGGQVARKSLPVALKVFTQGAIDVQDLEILKGAGDELGGLLETLAKDSIKAYEDKKKSIAGLRENLQQFTQAITTAEDSSAPLVIFVDELDRCRPDYAVALLERVKHLFNVNGVFFVLSIDHRQIVSSVESIYGQSMDADGYLRRFIDLRYQLPGHSTQSFCQSLIERFKLQEFFLERYKENRYRHDQSELDILLKTFIPLATAFQFSLRELEQYFTEMNVVLRTTGPGIKIMPHLLAYFVVIKHRVPDLYKEFQSPRSNPNNLVTRTRGLLSGDNFLERYVEPWMASEIIRIQNDPYNKEMYSSIVAIAQDSEADEREKARAERIISFIQDTAREGNFITFVVARLNNIGRFYT